MRRSVSGSVSGARAQSEAVGHDTSAGRAPSRWLSGGDLPRVVLASRPKGRGRELRNENDIVSFIRSESQGQGHNPVRDAPGPGRPSRCECKYAMQARPVAALTSATDAGSDSARRDERH